jgi:hypothetical protein
MNIEIGANTKKATETAKWIPWKLSLKTPIEISAIDVAANSDAPIFPTRLFPRKENNPNNAKYNPKNPLAYNPKLKRDPVMPGIMPKSLRALFVQLNLGKDVMAVRIQTNASIGAAIPVAAPILCLTIALFSGNRFVPLQLFMFDLHFKNLR